jgi:hypothetical protein
MSISGSRYFTGAHVSQAVISGLVLMASHVSLAVAADGAQPPKVVDPDLRMPNLVLPQQALVPPKRITFGQPLPGTLASTDDIAANGRPFDSYVFNTPAPNTYYAIRTTSNVPVVLVVYSNLSAPMLDGSSAFLTPGPGGRLSFIGRLNRPGQHILVISASDPRQPIGNYALSLIRPPAPVTHPRGTAVP